MFKSGTATATNDKPGIFERTQGFIQEVRSEMSKVNWPNREEVKSMTQVVMAALVTMGLITTVLDWIFLKVIQLVLMLS